MNEIVDLIIHPVRTRIIQALGTEQLTTQQIGERLPDIPQSSLYRHLRKLREGGVVVVTDTEPVRGVEERTYGVAGATLGPESVASLSAEDHLRLFTTYILTLPPAFANYLARAGEPPDLVTDRVGYHELSFYASAEELDAFAATINQALQVLLQNAPTPDRVRRKFITITHPD